jgi:8-oxo-dGTP pyrophosphatase MutT (NUDIX family)
VNGGGIGGASGPPDELLRALEGHPGADDKERRDRDAILALLRGTPEPFSRAQFSPGHLTGSAFVLDAKEERLLMLHHAKLDRWLQPGGHFEPGETDPFATALREAEEETGIRGLFPHPRAPRPFDVDVHSIPERRRGEQLEPAHEHHDIRYLLVAPHGAEATISAESKGLAWRPLAEAAGPDADAGLRRAVGKVRFLTFRPARCPR